MSNNPHHEAAEKRLRNGTINEVARAGVEATLALAYEQRTANIIAAMQAVSLSSGKEWRLNEDAHPAVLKMINDRLGLS